jgi:protein SCO1
MNQIRLSSKAFKAGAALAAAALALPALAQAPPMGSPQEKLTDKMGITQRLGAYVPTDVAFTDETGKQVQFGDLLGERPVILIPLFYRCTTMCISITDGLVKTLSKATRNDSLKPGRDFDVVMLGIHPKETHELAMAKKIEIFNILTPPAGRTEDTVWRNSAERGWHLLTGDMQSVRQITDAVGFKFSYDEQKDLINHPTCSIILTPDGKISSYTIGNGFPTKVLEDAIETAALNEVGRKADQSFMFGCIMLDPNTGKYTLVIQNVLRLAGILTVLIIAASIFTMSMKERRKSLEGVDAKLP